MKNRVIAALIAAFMACTILVLPASATEVKENNNPVDMSESIEMMPLDLPVASGDLANSTTGLEITKTLNKKNGKYVNLYVENNGTNSVVATINGQSERTFKPDEKGHIYLEVTQGFLGIDKEYKFQVVAGTNGGDVSLHYEIAQLDVVESVEMMPRGLSIDSGDINNKIGLEMTKTLNKKNGKYVNLYVENNGTNSVVATINGQSERTFQPGEKGHIYLEVTQGFWGIDKEYKFQVVAGTNGGDISLHYEIAQRDSQ